MDRAESSGGESQRRAKRTKRSSVACRRCHAQKVKCSGGTPCSACLTAGQASACNYPFRERKVTISESYLKQLEAASNALRHQNESARSQPRSPIDVDQLLDSTITSAVSDLGVVNPLFDARREKPPTQIVTEPSFVGEAACDAFIERLLQSLSQREANSLPPPHKYMIDLPGARMPAINYTLPDRVHAKLLIQVAARFIGNGQHLYLNSYMEEVDSVYKKDAEPSSIWLCKLLALVALGELYSNRRRSNGDNRAPGEEYFVSALGMLHDQYEDTTTLHVEVYLLLACYSNALGRVRSAYTYSGIGMRIALSLGMHRSSSSLHTSAVERESRRRIWWSLYLFDRLTCSKLGQPTAVNDDDIDVELPTMDGLTPEEKEEFPDPRHLFASVGLAKIAGDILSDIYCMPGRKKIHFVKRVHGILSNLRDWDDTLPQHLAFRWDDSNRHVASLHLCYNQCIIHTTRPILLHLFRVQFCLDGSRTADQPSQSFSPTTTALADSCVNAARTSNRILSKLFVDGTLAILGYWDAHYLFSSTLILLMSAVMSPSQAVSDAVDTALSVLCSMRDDGNVPANDYYERLLLVQKSIAELRDGVRKGRDGGPPTAAQSPQIAGTAHERAQLDEVGWAAQNNDVGGVGIENFRLEDNLDALANPYIDGFLAEKSFTWPSNAFPDGTTLQQFANELGVSFGLLDPHCG
ncbi:transcriptional regulator family: Fungal Specific TF [Penicillium roqueforti]|nr:transcriptional regulator family: Fungal Specific TF [Penicillium roqueforti]KAI3158147.1 transcriptional regulator family: Fungal Specific TF [Penicillium roqueforti]KAI3189947.1 transcriptional regulator family: Fungal Specific TF [Penicillium roqueforti]